MTINKSLGQTIKVAVLHLESQCFSREQLHEACFRISNAKNLYIFIQEKKSSKYYLQVRSEAIYYYIISRFWNLKGN